jgi:hypothetical protein
MSAPSYRWQYVAASRVRKMLCTVCTVTPGWDEKKKPRRAGIHLAHPFWALRIGRKTEQKANIKFYLGSLEDASIL